MTRVLQPELLDELPSEDPRAIHSRRDLRRINALMGNARAISKFVSATLREGPSTSRRVVIAEIGAGEGFIASETARVLSRDGFNGELLLVDRLRFETRRVDGWEIQSIACDVFEWIDEAPRVDVIVANLFLHHFTDQRVRELFQRCARLCGCFAAAEPRRSAMGAWFSRRVGLIGCNEVTRHDAEISVRAGFEDRELSRLWPQGEDWKITEKRDGLFTHFFGAERRV
ncbi:MAG: methyltransferase domain-containing protein [Limisphaerales bacterium]